MVEMKAEKRDMISALDKKSNKDTVKNILSRKANKSEIDSILVRKADIVTNSLSKNHFQGWHAGYHPRAGEKGQFGTYGAIYRGFRCKGW